MRLRHSLFLAAPLAALLLAMAPRAGATVIVPNEGATPWMSWTYTLTEDFTGTAGIGVSDLGDSIVESYLMLDNLQGFGLSNPGFETGDLSGYTANGSGASVVGGFTDPLGRSYSPTEGGWLAVLGSVDGDSGASTGFLPEPGATDGTWLAFDVALSAGDVISFDWAFATTDYIPFRDFAFVYAVDDAGQLVFFEKLAQIGAVPAPAPLALLGAGLLAAAVRRRRA